MDKKLKILGSLLAVFVLIAIAHSAAHFYFFGTGIAGFLKSGLLGLAIDESAVNGGEEGSKWGASASQILVIVEWVLVFSLLILSYSRNKSSIVREVKDLRAMKNLKTIENATEIDVLYEMLKEMKSIGFPAIEEVFGVDRSVVKSWAETLRLGNLATVEYPRIGEPELVLIRKNS